MKNNSSALSAIAPELVYSFLVDHPGVEEGILSTTGMVYRGTRNDLCTRMIKYRDN